MITFQDKVSLNTDPSIPEINKITDQNINDLKAGVNTNESDIDNLKTLTLYSTTETQTDKKWMNNKPIYRKVIELPAITSTNTDLAIQTGITNMENIIKIEGMMQVSMGWIPLNFHNKSNDYYSIITWINNSGVIQQRSQFTSSGGYAVLEYTKTTD